MITGSGFTDRFLTEQEIESLCDEALNRMIEPNERVLFIIPDHTRSAPIDLIFRYIYKKLSHVMAHLDFLIALGTHPPMSETQIYDRVGITSKAKHSHFSQARFFNHHWNDPVQLVQIGTLSETVISEISGGLLKTPVNVTMNRMVLDYDRIVIIGPTFPHEVVGFSGGSKYLFPGIAGAEIIDMFHWLGALITNMGIIGHADTPVRRIVDAAAGLLPIPVQCISLVVQGEGLAGLFAGPSREAWQHAAALSEKLHIQYKDSPFRSVLSCAPKMYDDLWTGAKCMYKLEPVVADGGELIIYAPHISEVSVTHGRIIEQIGYHVRDYFVKQWDSFKQFPGGVLAHSTHVKGAGTFENGVENPRIKVTLATSIPEAVCKKINLGYLDHRFIDPSEWINRENEGRLYVQKAGEMLYRLNQ